MAHDSGWVRSKAVVGLGVSMWAEVGKHIVGRVVEADRSVMV